MQHGSFSDISFKPSIIFAHVQSNYTELHGFKYNIKINQITWLDFNLSLIKFSQSHNN